MRMAFDLFRAARGTAPLPAAIANQTILWRESFMRLIRFFNAHPDYKQKFKAFNDTPIEELADNRGFQVGTLAWIILTKEF